MIRPGLALVSLTVLVAINGCRSCRGEKPEPATADLPSPGVEPTQSSTAKPSSPPEPQVMPAARLLSLPPSFFGLDRATHVKLRVTTQRLGAPDPESKGPTDLPGFAFAALDTGGREPDADRWNRELDDLYHALMNAKVFTAAKPMMIIWNAREGRGTVDWSIGVPVAPDTHLEPPLIRREVPAMKVHVVRGTAREILSRFGPTKDEEPSVWTFVGKVRRSTSVRLTWMAFRFLDITDAPLDDESLMEVLAGEPLPIPPDSSEPAPEVHTTRSPDAAAVL